MKLRSETNDPNIASDILAAFPHEDEHEDVHAFFEHGQWWVMCNPCGEQYSVYDVGGDGYGFEIVTVGDGTCLPEEDY